MNYVLLMLFLSSLSLSVFASEKPNNKQHHIIASSSKESKSPRSLLSVSMPNIAKTAPIDIPNSGNNLRRSDNTISKNSFNNTYPDNICDIEKYALLSRTYSDKFPDHFVHDQKDNLLVFGFPFSDMGYTPSPKNNTPKHLKPSK